MRLRGFSVGDAPTRSLLLQSAYPESKVLYLQRVFVVMLIFIVIGDFSLLFGPEPLLHVKV